MSPRSIRRWRFPVAALLAGLLLSAGLGAVFTSAAVADTPPAFTSANQHSFTVDQFEIFAITTSGTPAPSLTLTSGVLPDGLTFTDNNDGTAFVYGIPTNAGAGSTTVTITATNAVSSVTQQLTIEVDTAPMITSANTTTFLVGVPAHFTVTTTGSPFPALTIPPDSMLPGLTFTDNGDGTATIGGTVTGSPGMSDTPVTATNNAGSDFQVINIVVNQRPVFVSDDTATFAVGGPGEFYVVTNGQPTPTVALTSGVLPDGLTITYDGNGAAFIAGTPAAGTGGRHTLVFSATSPSMPTATQALTLEIEESPAFTSSATGQFQVGVASTVRITTSGSPPASLTLTGALPPGLRFRDLGDGTATVTGTPTSASAPQYPVVITATNDQNTAFQSLLLTVLLPSAVPPPPPTPPPSPTPPASPPSASSGPSTTSAAGGVAAGSGSQSLAATGIDVRWELGTAAMALVIGLGLLGGSRRREPRPLRR